MSSSQCYITLSSGIATCRLVVSSQKRASCHACYPFCLSATCLCQNLSCIHSLWWYPGSSGQGLNPTKALPSEGVRQDQALVAPLACSSVWCGAVLGCLCRAARGRGSSLADPATLFPVPLVPWNILFSSGVARQTQEVTAEELMSLSSGLCAHPTTSLRSSYRANLVREGCFSKRRGSFV